MVTGATVTLTGAGSSSSNGPLTYAWTLTSVPGNSKAALLNPNTISPTFVADNAGSYTAQLIVNDGTNSSDPASVTITAMPATPNPPASITATGGTPQNVFVNSPLCTPLTAVVKDVNGAPVNGVPVTFTAQANGASGMFASGATATVNTDAQGIATAPAFTANGAAGSYTVIAAVPNVNQTATFSLTNVLLTLKATSGMYQSTSVNTAFAAPLVATVSAGSGCGNPVSGLTVTFDASSANGTFAGGALSAMAITDSNGVATSPVFTANSSPGSYNVTAFVPGGAASVSFPLLNVPQLGAGGLSISSATVGKNLETTVTITLAQPAGPSGVQVNVVSGDQSRLLVSGRLADPGTGFVPRAVGISAGSSTTTIFVQGLDSTGTVPLTAFGNDGSSGTGTITLAPSGFVLSGPNGLGIQTFSTGTGINSVLTVTPARLDSSFNLIEPQPLRPGITASVPVTSSDTTVGVITSSPVLFTAIQNSSATTQFNALGTGTAIITAGVPAGFSTPANNGNTLTAIIGSTLLTAGSASVGNNLEALTNVTLSGGAPTNGLRVALTSSDPSKLLFSIAPDAAGSGILDDQHSGSLVIPQGLNHTRDFYVQALAGTGSVTYTAVASRSDGSIFGSSTGTVTLTPSGIVISGPSTFTTAPGAAPTQINVQTVQLDGLTNPVQPLRGGISLSVGVISSAPSVGTISQTPIAIAGGASSASTSFTPLAVGSSSVTASAPGFGSASVTANVAQSGISLPDAGLIGMNLQVQSTLTLGQFAPVGGVTVTLTSSDATSLLLSNTANVQGSKMINVQVPAGSNSASFYLQALAGSGAPTYTAASLGYKSSTATATLVHSAVILSSKFGADLPFATPASVGQAEPLTVSTVALQPDGTYDGNTPQPIRGGSSVTVPLTVNPTGKGALSVQQVTIQGGNGSAPAQYTPSATGQVTISVATPAGGYLTAPSNYPSVMLNVN